MFLQNARFFCSSYSSASAVLRVELSLCMPKDLQTNDGTQNHRLGEKYCASNLWQHFAYNVKTAVACKKFVEYVY